MPSMRALCACPLCMPSVRALCACPLCVPSMRACLNAENLPNFCSGTAKSQLHLRLATGHTATNKQCFKKMVPFKKYPTKHCRVRIENCRYVSYDE